MTKRSVAAEQPMVGTRSEIHTIFASCIDKSSHKLTLCFKEWDHVHPDGIQWGRNREVVLALQRARPRTRWWHTMRPKLGGSTCLLMSEITYILMVYNEAKIARQHFSFKERDHAHSDGTQWGRNREATLVLQRVKPRTSWWHIKKLNVRTSDHKA